MAERGWKGLKGVQVRLNSDKAVYRMLVSCSGLGMSSSVSNSFAVLHSLHTAARCSSAIQNIDGAEPAQSVQVCYQEEKP